MSLRPWQGAMARGAAIALLVLLSACGGGGGGSSSDASTLAGTSSPTPSNAPVTLPGTAAAGANVVPVVVDEGTDGSAFNMPFVNVTVCLPASSTCQAIDHVLLDTGSYGLRIAASALNTALPPVLAPGGAPLAECAGFVSGYTWGSVRTADVQIGGETALGVPIQVVDDSSGPYAAVPAACSNTGPNMGVGPGAKGILGVGMFRHDCGSACVSSAAPAVYFACPATGCASTMAPLASQVTNPVALFPTDNNGVAITLPEVPVGGVPSVTGVMVFGVGTAANNQLGSAQVFAANASGNFGTTYKGTTLAGFLDSGSNGIFLHDASLSACGNGFYCPASTMSLTASVTGTNGTSRDVPFTVENVSRLPSSAAAARAAGDIGLSRSFDWGLPFFFGRTVFVAMQGAATPFGTGPYWGF